MAINSSIVSCRCSTTKNLIPAPCSRIGWGCTQSWCSAIKILVLVGCLSRACDWSAACMHIVSAAEVRYLSFQPENSNQRLKSFTRTNLSRCQRNDHSQAPPTTSPGPPVSGSASAMRISSNVGLSGLGVSETSHRRQGINPHGHSQYLDVEIRML